MKNKCFVAEHEEEQLAPWDKHLREKRQRRKERKRRNREKVGVGETRTSLDCKVSSPCHLSMAAGEGAERGRE